MHRSISKIRPFCCVVYIIITISWITQANCDISQLEICRSWPITEGHWGCFSEFTCSDVESAAHNYNEVLQNNVDKHAPWKTRVVTIRPEAPWYNSSLAEEKRLKRKYERKYNKSKLVVDRELYCHQLDEYNNLLNTTKQDYFKNKIESATSTKERFKVCNNLLNWTN